MSLLVLGLVAPAREVLATVEVEAGELVEEVVTHLVRQQPDAASASTEPNTTESVSPDSRARPHETPPVSPSAAHLQTDAQTRQRRLVFLNLYTLNFSVLFPLIPVPSLDVSLFLGGDVMPRSSNSRIALGYQFTFSVGGADLPALAVVREPPHDPNVEVESILIAPPIVYHRHHLMLAGRGGRRGHLFYSLAGGVWLYGFRYTQFAGPEAEARVGYRFRVRADSRLCGVVGGQLRLSGAIGGYPIPQLGAFVGLMVF